MGERLRYSREKVGLLQKQVDAKIGVSLGTTSRWENESYSPRLRHLMELSKLYQVTMNWLLEGE